MILLRSLVFHAAFYLTTAALAILGLPFSQSLRDLQASKRQARLNNANSFAREDQPLQFLSK
jgi:hypothetical protein